TTLKLAFHREHDDAAREAETTVAAPTAATAALVSDVAKPSGFQIQRELGRGGMGIIYLATRKHDDKPIALKIVAPAVAGPPQQFADLLRQARTLTALGHPNIVRLQEAGESDGYLFFVSDYVSGLDAAALLKKSGPMEVSRVLRLGEQLLDALAYAH